ncbi:ammonium transporter [Tribonema minus]|uniref:Ammonium transporter n=1 Tax=Tribonema minus TaxID=303371 RepID=A0A835YJG4_9STRA|nr:ammonium transporter [Tribonema minus]
MADLQVDVDALAAAVVANSLTIRALVLLAGAVLTFFMQTGYAMVHVGCVQLKNTKNTLITNVFDSALASMVWWLIGFGFAFGDSDSSSNPFIGSDGFALSGSEFRGDDPSSLLAIRWAWWLLQWAFAGTTVTITSGAVAERITWPAYAMYSAVFLGFIYPVVVYWAWSMDGWASPYLSASDDLLSNCGVIDHAGSGVVHVSAGMAALVGAAMLGSRHGRFIEGIAREMPKASWVYQTLGTLILWFGWFGMVGSIGFGYTSGGDSLVAARAMVNAAIAAGTSCLTCVILSQLLDTVLSMEAANNGILSGLVAIAAGAAVVEPEGAFVIGFIAALCYFFGARLLVKIQVDDVVNASPVHLCAGAWGLIAPGLFATGELYQGAYGVIGGREQTCCGAFYGCSGDQLGAQLAFLVVIVCWVGTLVAATFFVAKVTVGLRLTTDIEDVGMDLSKHGGLTLAAVTGVPPVLQHLAQRAHAGRSDGGASSAAAPG